MGPDEYQVGGSHYRSAYQLWDVVEEYGVGFLEGNAAKYVVRHRRKNGAEDLHKAAHYVSKLVSLVETNGREPRGRVPVGVAARFAGENGLVGAEIKIVHTLFTWSRVEELRIVHALLLRLAERAGDD